MKCSPHISVLSVLSLILLGSLLFPQTSYGSSSTDVDAKIQISVCGNLVAEGEEDCDNTDIKGATCQSLGYGGGALSCNISCSYDTSACVAPSATPLVTQSVNSSTEPQTQPVEEPTAGEQQLSDPEVVQNSPEIPEGPLRFLPDFGFRNDRTALPKGLQFFDLNNVGKILFSDLSEVVTLWVDEWRLSLKNQSTGKKIAQKSNEIEKCDVNLDKVCDLKDFSILMSYVEK